MPPGHCCGSQFLVVHTTSRKLFSLSTELQRTKLNSNLVAHRCSVPSQHEMTLWRSPYCKHPMQSIMSVDNSIRPYTTSPSLYHPFTTATWVSSAVALLIAWHAPIADTNHKLRGSTGNHKISLGSIVLAVSVTEDYKEKGATLGVVVWFLVVLVQSGFFVGCHHCIEGGGWGAASLAWNNATRGRGSGLAGKCVGGGSDEVDGRHASCPELYHPFTTAIHHPIFPLSKHNQSTHEL
jgi:hypothetical protein